MHVLLLRKQHLETRIPGLYNILCVHIAKTCGGMDPVRHKSCEQGNMYVIGSALTERYMAKDMPECPSLDSDGMESWKGGRRTPKMGRTTIAACNESDPPPPLRQGMRVGLF